MPVIFHDERSEAADRTDGFVWQRTARGNGGARGSAAPNDHPPTLKEMLDLVDGRVPLVIELKGIPGHDDGLGRGGSARCCAPITGKAAIMSFDHWLIRHFQHMPATFRPG